MQHSSGFRRLHSNREGPPAIWSAVAERSDDTALGGAERQGNPTPPSAQAVQTAPFARDASPSPLRNGKGSGREVPSLWVLRRGLRPQPGRSVSDPSA
ncbi:hypothetical protein SBV1_860014 [Verrucomicrobia bacterium]|nr:hypothetical protein SBV1_860014 [Verrucomicrobiota bacterium]